METLYPDLEIPDFLIRNPDGSFKFPRDTAPVKAQEPEPVTEQDPFAQFKGELYDPEPAITAEARKRWHQWIPTKEEPRQPALNTMKSRVRAEWKKEGRI